MDSCPNSDVLIEEPQAATCEAPDVVTEEIPPSLTIATDAKPKRNHKREITLVATLFILAIFLNINFRQGRVTGESMMPTYKNGETVLVWKTAPVSKIKPGDVIIFKDKNGDELIKRVAFIRHWGTGWPNGFYVNPNGGRLIPYSYLFGDYFLRVRMGRTPAPPRDATIYVLGDNLMNSDDSRNIGPISPKQILGKVIP